jgi:hypothetical protein
MADAICKGVQDHGPAGQLARQVPRPLRIRFLAKDVPEILVVRAHRKAFCALEKVIQALAGGNDRVRFLLCGALPGGHP